MMRAMLVDRFQLVTHHETRTLPVYALTVAKGGLKLPAGDGQAGRTSWGPRLIRFASGTMSELAGRLSSYMDLNVIDKTGMPGQYAINLSFAPTDLGMTSGDTALDSGPSIFQALQEQAGLKLESTKGPVEVLVIDHAEKPDAN